MSERQGIEIDYCPNCRGVWLDRGELDKIIERSTSDMGRGPDDRYRDDDDDRRDYERGGYRGRKRGFLGNLFDFD
jgi:Zn-finger nucleic acid-binding protein